MGSQLRLGGGGGGAFPVLLLLLLSVACHCYRRRVRHRHLQPRGTLSTPSAPAAPLAGYVQMMAARWLAQGPGPARGTLLHDPMRVARPQPRRAQVGAARPHSVMQERDICVQHPADRVKGPCDWRA